MFTEIIAVIAIIIFIIIGNWIYLSLLVQSLIIAINYNNSQ
jgi:hypothetical protein